MANIDAICQACDPKVQTVFGPGGTRQSEVIAGDLFVSDQCFVRDEIRFLNNGRLIFVPIVQGERERYLDEYFVICRKLTIIGGSDPIIINPCGPDDPGKLYSGNNVITWRDRLVSAAAGAGPNPFHATDGTSHDPNNWSDVGQGNGGAAGGSGGNGVGGSKGTMGRDAPKFSLVVLEVEAGLVSHLTIDFDGQNGGRGGRGQNGGAGGNGMGGRDGDTDPDWPSADDCERQPGSGGNSGNGGDGGPGGPCGNGGRAGDITIWSTNDQITTGPLISGKVTYVNDGGSGGEGGLGGVGGKAGLFAGKPGFKTSACDAASSGGVGSDGQPGGLPNGPGSLDTIGSTGAHGAAATVKFNPLALGHCADVLPLPITVAPIAPPLHVCRGFSNPATAEASITGQNLLQVTSVTTSLAGVTATIRNTSTDTQLDLLFSLTAGSALGAGNLVLHPAFGADVTLPGVLTADKFLVTAVAPANGARGTAVAVTITGTCFDSTAVIQSVNVGGVGVNVVNVVVIDDHTIQCTFEIASLAPANARSVTVHLGLLQHTLVNAFTVTP